MNLTNLFHYLVSLSLLGSFLTLGIFIIKQLFKHKLSAKWHYYIWFVLVLRLIIPYMPSTTFSVFSLLPQYSSTFYISQDVSQPAVNPDPSDIDLATTPIAGSESGENTLIPSQSDSKLRLNWVTAAFLWLSGVLAIFFYMLAVNSFMLFKLKNQQVCENPKIKQILEDCRINLNIRTKVSVIYEDSLKSPALFGLFRPKILISQKLTDLLSLEELRFIFLHELSHLKRHDLAINMLITLMQVIYWFNPLIYYSLHQMKQDCEIACDATALASIKPEDHKKYGQTIIRLLQLLSEPHWASGTLGFANRFNTRRIIMISNFKRSALRWSIAALALTLIVGCSSLSNPISQISNNQSQGDTSNSQETANNDQSDSNSILYENAQYGFKVTLPKSWKGYSIESSQWEGLASGQTAVVETGPKISIRDPLWTSEIPRQDIPILIFTLNQWNALQQEVFHIGAAPIGPSELGRNNSYVFALPARYNFAFPPGYEEVEKILATNPLHTTQVTQQHPDAAESLLSDTMVYGEQGKVIYSDFSAKTNTIDDVEKVWGKADKTDYVAAAKGRYATYSGHNVVFGINKGNQIFEVRSFDNRLKSITLETTKKVLGTPAYDVKDNGQEIIGYITGSDFKVEMVFTQPTTSNPNPVMDHYNVLYPRGTVNGMADDPGRQW